MPKLKTKRSIAKRVKITGSGKVKRSHSCSSHKFTSKSPKRKRHLRSSALISKADSGRIRKLLGLKRTRPARKAVAVEEE